MVELPNATHWRSSSTPQPAEIDLATSLRSAASGLWRQRGLIVLVTLGMTLLTVLHVLTAQPLYTARASIIIDPRISTSPGETVAPALLLSDALVVDSEVVVLQSRDLLDRLIDRLGLIDENAPPPEPGLVTRLGQQLRELSAGVLGTALPPRVDDEVSAGRLREKLRRNLANRINIERVGGTYVIGIAVTDGNPVSAAETANALVDEYFAMQARAQADHREGVTAWLSERVEVLAGAVQAADAAVEAYRSEAGLFAVENERLPAAAELVTANRLLVETRTEMLTVGAQLDQLRESISSGDIQTGLEGDLRSSTFIALHARFIDLTEQEKILTARLGPNATAVGSVRDQLAQARDNVLDELGRIAERMERQLEGLSRRAEATEGRIVELRRLTMDDAQKSIRLRELEREAAGKRVLYESMLAQLNSTTEQQTFESSAARVIARAVPPDTKSAPQSKMLVVLAVVGGLILGSGGAFLRETMDNRMRRPEDVQDELGFPLIGVAPNFADDLNLLRRGDKGRAISWREQRHGKLTRKGAQLRFAADHPQSMFADSLRSLMVALNRQDKPEQGGRVVALTSVRKGEGKSILAGNLATMLAGKGHRVVLLGLDMRRPALGDLVHELPPENQLDRLVLGLSEVEEVQPNQALHGLHLISNTGPSQLSLADEKTRRDTAALVEKLRRHFDHVVVDLGPSDGFADSRAAMRLFDSLVLAVEWGQTRKEALRRAVQDRDIDPARFLGAIYTKVPISAYVSYNGRLSREYYKY